MSSIQPGLYEQLVNKLIANKLQSIDKNTFYIHSGKVDVEEAARYLSLYLFDVLKYALSEIKDGDRLLRQVEISNKIIELLIRELPKLELSENLIENEGLILEAVINKLDSPYNDFKTRLKQITLIHV